MMNHNFAWTIFAVAIYWLAFGAVGNEWVRHIVAGAGIVISIANVLRYLPAAWQKYRADRKEGEWRMLMAVELFWLGFGSREFYLLGDRLNYWDATDNPLNGFFAYWILCAGLLCFSAVNDPMPIPPRQNGYVIAAVMIAGVLLGMVLYRFLWG